MTAPFLKANPGITGSCTSVTVGNTLNAKIEDAAVMGYLMLTTDNTGNDTGTQGYTLQCNSPDGKFSIRVRIPATTTTIAYGDQTINVNVRNNLGVMDTVIWSYNTEYGAYLGNAGILAIPSQVWGGDGDTGVTWANVTNANIGFWGNIGIYDASNRGPEYRRYTWIPMGAANKVSYEAHIMAAIDEPNPSLPISPTALKVYIKLEQVTAQ